ncbi:MAG TPA: hypothetical protein VGY77_02900 [Gemmataceae bacterium]|nr:hypothetical protein [Gemmataceae bacterium]
MKGFIAKTMTAIYFAGGSMMVAGGCYGYKDLVDPCYPERYEYAARQSVKQFIGPQVQNGHILDQTIWNYHFEPGTASMTEGGRAHLTYLGRRRPAPDSIIYLQVAHDIAYDPAAPDKYVDARNDLDNKRIKAIQDFLGAETAGRSAPFTVVRHDPSEVGQSAVAVGRSIQGLQATAQGTLARGGAGGGGGGGGGGGASAGASPGGR